MKRYSGIVALGAVAAFCLGLLTACPQPVPPPVPPPPEEDTEAPSIISYLTGAPGDTGEVYVSWKQPIDNVGVTGHKLFAGKYNNLDPNDPAHQPFLTEITGLPAPANAGDTLEKLVKDLPGAIRRFFYIAAYDAAGNAANYAKVEVIAGGMPTQPGEYWGLVGAPASNGTAVDGVDEIGNHPIDNKKVVSTPYGDLHFGEVKDGYYIVSFENWENGIPVKINCYVANTGAATTLGSGSTELNLTSGIKSLSMKGFIPSEMPKALEWYINNK